MARTRSAEYRARRKVRHAMRRMRGAEQRDYQVMLERTSGYADMLEGFADVERLADEWEDCEAMDDEMENRIAHDYESGRRVCMSREADAADFAVMRTLMGVQS